MKKTLSLSFLVLLCSASYMMAQPFTYTLMQHKLPIIRNGDAALGDYDRDGDYDLVVFAAIDNLPEGTIFQNTGLSVESLPNTPPFEVQNFFNLRPGLPDIMHSAVELADFNHDGLLDIAVMGATSETAPFNPVAYLYTNPSAAQNARLHTTLMPLHSGDISFGDYDNDGDLDLLLCGVDNNEQYHTVLYQNNNGTFTDSGLSFEGFGYADIAWGDFNNDDYLDFAISGSTAETFKTLIFKNNGDGTFTELGTNLARVTHSSISWGDYDNDLDLDLLVTGAVVSPELLRGTTQVFRNDNGVFNDANLDLIGVFAGESTWGDYDNDGDLDIYVFGAENPRNETKGRVYQNHGNGVFYHTINLVGLMQGFTALADYDNDNDLDIMGAGWTGEFNASVVYRNEFPNLNFAPEPPTNLKAETISGGQILLSWDDGSDLVTPNQGLSYNIRIGTTPGGSEVMSAMSLANGKRLISQAGNAGPGTSGIFKPAANTTYYWSVQALDSSLEGSAFSEEVSFTSSSVSSGTSVSNETDTLPNENLVLHSNYPNPFQSSTTLKYELPRDEVTSLKVYDLLGHEVRTLVNDFQNSGVREITWDGKNEQGSSVASGIYLVEIRAGNEMKVQKVILNR